MVHASRRDLLKLAGLGAVGIAGCTSKKPAALPSPTPTPTTSPSKTPESWSQLADSLSGALRQPGSAGYDQARQLFNPTFDSIHPQGVAQCASADDVVRALAFAHAQGLKVAARSGGHSYVGCSTTDGLVIDLRKLNTVKLGPGTATIGAGAALIDVYAALTAEGVSISAGSCPTVGIAGLALGGGYGVVSRMYGLTCDALISAEVVLADGRMVTASATSEPDLYWALRGGGGTCGIVTSFVFKTFTTQDVTIYAMGWDWSQAAAVLDAWQNWISTLPDETFSTCKLLGTYASQPNSSPQIGVYGLHLGSAADLAPHLDALQSHIVAKPTYRTSTPSSFAHAMFAEAGCADKDINHCRLATRGGAGELERQAFIASSDFITAKLPRTSISNLVAAVTARQSDGLAGGGVSFDAYGGAINRVAADATAFVHRSALAVLQYSAPLPGNASTEVVATNRRSISSMKDALKGHVSGEAYQNYLDSTLTDPATAYFGDNLVRLKQVQTEYDPQGVFACPALLGNEET